MPKKRVNLYLDAELYDRFQGAVSDLPEMSVSSVINDLMAETVPVLENLAQALRAEDRAKARSTYADYLSGVFVRMVLGDEEETEDVEKP